MSQKNIVIYHKGCFDGVAGAWVCRQALRDDGVADDNITFHPSDYVMDPPDVKRASVIIVDFSYKREVMLKLIEDASHVTVIDHHKTAKEALQGLQDADVFFDMDKSGAALAWDLLMHGPRPLAIDYIEDRDLWKFRYPNTKPFIAALAATDLTIDNFGVMVGKEAYFIQKGTYILDYINTFGKKACEHWNIHRIGGYDVPVINVPYMNSSDHVDLLASLLPGHPFYAYYFETAGGKWQFGLRSKEMDVSEIAKQYGGGGHAPAAGFTVDVLPWMFVHHDGQIIDPKIHHGDAPMPISSPKVER